MAFGLHGAINIFQKKIGTYDKANWEITVEKQEVQQVLNEKLSIAKLPTDLLDIDLIRGSTFTKAKPGYHWTQVSRSGFFKVLFFPLYYKWWLQQVPLRIWSFFVLLYFMQLLSLVIYISNQPHEDFSNVSWPEAFVPLMAMFCLGEMYIHVVSTNFTKPIGHKIKKVKKQKSESSTQRRKSRRKSRNEKRDLLNRGRHTERTGLRDGQAIDTSVERHSREESIERVLAKEEQVILKEYENKKEEGSTLRRRLIEKPQISDVDSLCSGEPSPRLDTNTDHVDATLRQSSGSIEEESSEEENSDTDASTSSMSDPDDPVNQANQFTADLETTNLLFPQSEGVIDVTQSNMLCHIRRSNDLVSVSIWDGSSFKKAKLTFFEIGIAVMNKVESRKEKASDYISFALISSIFIGLLPLTFRIYQAHVMNGENRDRTLFKAALHVYDQLQSTDGLIGIYKQLFGKTWRIQLVVVIAMISRITLSFSMFFLLCVAEGAYKARYMYAKFFAALTSTRKSRRNGLPHFRLHKVKNIKAWLSLRSFLKKRGPQRSVDTIVSMAFMFGVLMIVVTCVQFIKINAKDEKDHFLSYFFSWEVTAWSLVVGVFLIRFIALGSDINRKYRNTSILLTEQINLYLQMERSGSKKEELLIANNVLKLASKLLKELEGPFKVSGFIMNPLLSNIVRVVVLSLFSGVMSDILGFRLRLWKIKP